jgi:hypothetical protein
MNVQELREKINQEIDNFEDGIINIKELEGKVGLYIDQYTSEYKPKKKSIINVIKWPEYEHIYLRNLVT